MKSRLLLYYAIAIGTCFLWFYFIYSPLTRKQQEVKVAISEKELQIIDFNKTIKELSHFVQTSNYLQSDKEELSSQLYSKGEILNLFKQLNSDAVNHSLQITEIIPPLEELLQLNKVVPNAEEPLFLNITLKFNGNYINFGKYLINLEKAPFFRGINYCKITSPQENNSKLNLTVNFKALLGKIGEKG